MLITHLRLSVVQKMPRVSIFYILSILALNHVIPSIGKSHLGATVPICDVKDGASVLDTCVMNAANKVIPRLTKGIRELDLPPIDPLYIPHMDFGQEEGSVYFKLSLSDTVHTGLSKVVVSKVTVAPEKLIIQMDAFVPKYTLLGHYNGHGRILLLPINGVGMANFTFTDLKMSLTFHLSKKVEKGREYFKVEETDTNLGFAPGKNVLQMRQTEGDLTLAKHTSRFLSENADEVFNGMKGTLEKVYSDIFMNLVRRTFQKVPISKLFKNWP